jgi:hypothetical protein
MDEAQYWAIVERAKARGGSHVHARVSTVRDELRALPLEGLIAFHECHVRVYRTLLTQSFAEAAMKAALADDDEFAHAAVSWVLSEGEQLYSAVRTDAAVLGDYPVRRLASLLSEYATTSYELLAAENIVAVDPLSLDPSA